MEIGIIWTDLDQVKWLIRRRKKKKKKERNGKKENQIGDHMYLD